MKGLKVVINKLNHEELNVRAFGKEVFHSLPKFSGGLKNAIIAGAFVHNLP